MVLTDSVNVYLAARAAFLLVKHQRFLSGPDCGQPVAEKIHRLAFPGLGTGVGQLGPNTCASQLRTAIDDILLDRYTPPRSWAEASERHQLLYTDYPRRLQRGRLETYSKFRRLRSPIDSQRLAPNIESK